MVQSDPPTKTVDLIKSIILHPLDYPHAVVTLLFTDQKPHLTVMSWDPFRHPFRDPVKLTVVEVINDLLTYQDPKTITKTSCFGLIKKEVIYAPQPPCQYQYQNSGLSREEKMLLGDILILLAKFYGWKIVDKRQEELLKLEARLGPLNVTVSSEDQEGNEGVSQ